MTAKELTRIFEKGECLSLDTMKLYSDGKLPKKSAHVVEAHLLECGLCAGAMEGLNSKRIAEVTKLSSHIQRRLAVYMNTPPEISFFRRFGFSIIAGLLLLSGGTTIWYFASKTTNNDVQISDTALTSISQQTYIQPGQGQPNNVTNNVAGDPKSDVQQNAPASTVSNTKNNSAAGNSTTLQDLPATQPGKDNTSFTVDPQQNSTPNNNSNSDGSNSRTANTNSLIHIKSILIYPPVTHDDGKGGRKSSSDGQLGRSDPGGASFKLEDMPKYPGGDDAIRAYINSNFKAMNIDRSKLKRFSTGIILTVDSKSGKVSNAQLSFPISPEVDAEILRVLNSMPNWTPGKKRGEVDVMLGFTFE